MYKKMHQEAGEKSQQLNTHAAVFRTKVQSSVPSTYTR